MKKSIIIIPVILIIINLPPISWFTKIFIEDYTYSSFNRGFRYEEYQLKGSTFDGAKSQFEDYKKRHPNMKDIKLYRNFTLKPWRFWEWHQWVTDFERYKLPYLFVKE